MVADDIKVRFSADAVSYQLAAIPVVSEESLGRQRERHPETRGGERVRHAIRPTRFAVHHILHDKKNNNTTE